MSENLNFASRLSIQQVEEGTDLAPKFNSDGLLPVVTTDSQSGEVLMLGFMNAEALEQTIASAEAHYWSRSRQMIWRKGSTSGLIQEVVDMRIDDDQDAIWLSVLVSGNGASCHVGYRSCFYRSIPTGVKPQPDLKLRFREDKKVFDPQDVYGDEENPTQL
jgi:phosphoribosyl-AMP cyclohydrolase